MLRRTHVLMGIVCALVFVVTGIAAQDQPSLYTLPDARVRLVNSSSFIQAGDGLMITANMLNHSVTFVDLYAGERIVEVPVGRDPRTVALIPNGTRAVVANRGSGDISVLSLADRTVIAVFPVGLLPYAVIALDDNRALVSLQASNEVIIIDINTGVITQRIATPEYPAGLALWGDFVYVTHLWSGQLSMIYLPQGQVVRTISTGNDTALSQFVLIDPGRGVAYLPQSRLNVQNPSLTFDTTVFPVINVVDLRTMSLDRRARIALDTASKPVNMPFAGVLDSARRWLYVANAGSDSVSIIDLTTNLAVGSIQARANPRGVLLSRDAGTLYVHNMIDSTVTVYSTSTRAITDTIPLSDLLQVSASVQLGAQIFHSATNVSGSTIKGQMSADGWISCASCHFDGQADGRTWLGFEGGARNTPLLYNLSERAPYNADGSWDELADVEHKIRWLQAGGGLIEGTPNPPKGDPNAGLSLDLDNLTAYLFSLQGPSSPPPTDPAQVARGLEVFQSLGCESCHTGETGIDGLPHDVGTGGEFITPTLRWLWLSDPYLHDGRAPTLRELFIMPGTHQLIRETPLEDIDALVAYLLSR